MGYGCPYSRLSGRISGGGIRHPRWFLTCALCGNLLQDQAMQVTTSYCHLALAEHLRRESRLARCSSVLRCVWVWGWCGVREVFFFLPERMVCLLSCFFEVFRPVMLIQTVVLYVPEVSWVKLFGRPVCACLCGKRVTLYWRWEWRAQCMVSIVIQVAHLIVVRGEGTGRSNKNRFGARRSFCWYFFVSV